MTITVRARYINGQLTPMEPLDLEEGAEVIVSVEERPAADTSGKFLLEIFDRIHQSTPSGAWDNLPTDLAKNKKHYLYGHPREED